jgi:hypothetical protein
MSGVNLSSVNFVIPKRVGLETFLMEFQKITKSIICYFPGTKEIYFVSVDDLKHGMWKKYKSNDIAGCYYYHDEENDCDITLFSSEADKKLGSIPMDKGKKPKKSNVFSSIQAPILQPPPQPTPPVKQNGFYGAPNNYQQPNPQQQPYPNTFSQPKVQPTQQQQPVFNPQNYNPQPQPYPNNYNPNQPPQFTGYPLQNYMPNYAYPNVPSQPPPQPEAPIHPNLLRQQQSQDMKFYNGSKSKKPAKLESKFVA